MTTGARRISFGKGLLIIFAVALALRLVVCWELRDTSAVNTPASVTDMATYKELALAIRQGNWPAFFDYQPFYYTVFLPIAYFLSPDGSAWAPMLLQALVGAVTCVLAALTAAQLFGRRGGYLAGALLAISRFHIFYTPFLLLEVCFAFWAALVLYALVRLMRQFSWKWSALLGFACAGALLTRGNALLWLPGIGALILWRGWKQWRPLALVATAFILAYVLPIAPYSIHNSRAMGHFCGASVAGNKVLSLGNSPEAPAGGLEYPRTYYAWNADEESGKQSVLSHILQWAKEEPAAFLELEVRSLLLFWDHTEIPNNVCIDINGKDSKLLNLPLLLPWGILGALGFAGLLLNSWCLRKTRLAATWMTLAFWGATSAFYLLARFRIGFLPILCIGAAGGIMEVIRRIQTARRHPTQQNRNRLAWGGIAVLVAFFVVDIAHDTYCDLVMPAFFRTAKPNGIALEYNDEKVIYDHGPLGFGGTILLGVPKEGTEITKSFAVPEKYLSAEPKSQRLLLRIANSAIPDGTHTNARLALDGKELHATNTIVTDRTIQWIQFDFQAPVTQNPKFTVSLPPDRLFQSGAIAFDIQRDYQRTLLNGEPFPAEATAELILD